MLTITFANRKPGTGKSTSAVWLAHAYHQQGRKVLLVDADPAASVLEWSDIAGGFEFEVIGLPRRDLHQQLPGFARGMDVTVIDCIQIEDGGAVARAAMLAADEIVIPMAPATIELSRTIPVRDDIARVNAERATPARSCVLLNRCVWNANITREIRETLPGIGFDVLEHSVSNSVMYAGSFGGPVDTTATIWPVIADDLTRRAAHATTPV